MSKPSATGNSLYDDDDAYALLTRATLNLFWKSLRDAGSQANQKTFNNCWAQFKCSHCSWFRLFQKEITNN